MENEKRIDKEVIFSSEKSPLLIFRSSMPPEKTTFYEHHHTAFEITMVIDGSGIYSTNHSEFSFKSGDIFFFSTDEVHWLKKLDSRTNFLNIHFEPRFVWSDNIGISGKELIKVFLNRKNNPLNKLNTESESSKIIHELIYKMELEATQKKQEYETMLKVHLMNILVEMMRTFDGKLDESELLLSRHTLKYMTKVLNYIDENFAQDLTLLELSDIAHMSKTYFCRQFRELNGISPWEYITIKRIEKAISYIEQTDLTKLEIAAKCGYNNTSNFYYAFKKITGKSPSDYNKTTLA